MMIVGKKRVYAPKKQSKFQRVVKKVIAQNRLRRFAPITLSRTPTGFPNQLRFTHRYAETVTRQSTTGTINQYVWSANGLYDPNITGTGHQPLYFDQLTAVYNHYTVLRSKISIQVVPKIADATCNSMTCVVYQSDSASAVLGTPENGKEMPWASWTQISTLSNTFGPQNKLGLSFNAFKVFGSRALSDSELRGTISSNPTEQSYFIFLFRDSEGVANCTAIITVTIEYEAVWTEPKQIVSS